MDRETLFKYGFVLISTVILYLAYQVLKPFLITILLGFILTFFTYPLYKRLLKIVRKEWLASTIVIVLILFIIILPFAMIADMLITQSASAYTTLLEAGKTIVQIPLLKDLDPATITTIQQAVDNLVSQGKQYLVFGVPGVLGRVTQFVIQLFVLFFLIFYALIDGRKWYAAVKEITPLHQRHKDVLFDDIQKTTYGVVYGQFLTALVQGALGGIMFALFGIPNPIFWGFIMVIFAFIPILGTPMIFVPAGIFELVQHHYVAGIGVLVIGAVIVMNIDNILRPYFVSKFTRIHPAIVVIGVLGGLELLGLAGLVVGPMILALATTVFADLSIEEKKITKRG